MTQDNTFVSLNRSAGPKCGPLNPLFRPAGRMGDTSVLWESLLPKPASTPVHESTPGGRLSRERTPLRSRASHKNSHISSHNKSAPNQNARASSSTTHAKEGRTTSTKDSTLSHNNRAKPTPSLQRFAVFAPLPNPASRRFPSSDSPLPTSQTP
jgi:hypothetical protein